MSKDTDVCWGSTITCGNIYKWLHLIFTITLKIVTVYPHLIDEETEFSLPKVT